MRPAVSLWLAVGWIAWVALPWNAISGQGFFAFNWLAAYPLGARVAPGAMQLVHDARLWLIPVLVALALPIIAATRRTSDRTASLVLIASGITGSPRSR
jgi:iron(III) transport system permease protein